MRFSWDPDKSSANYRDRGFDFAVAAMIFDGPTLEREDSRRDYGERRIVATGLVDDLALTLCYTDRLDPDGEVYRRPISARRSNRREKKALQKAIARS
ncbi:MAG: BrnT family toxin [Gemmatimonadota bacterium]|nr:BrnT family toxin [Gemmatimonadota bacterium]